MCVGCLKKVILCWVAVGWEMAVVLRQETEGGLQRGREGGGMWMDWGLASVSLMPRVFWSYSRAGSTDSGTTFTLFGSIYGAPSVCLACKTLPHAAPSLGGTGTPNSIVWRCVILQA